VRPARCGGAAGRLATGRPRLPRDALASSSALPGSWAADHGGQATDVNHDGSPFRSLCNHLIGYRSNIPARGLPR
jgi:hypothetical protein